jgi:dihydrofolate reductase
LTKQTPRDQTTNLTLMAKTRLLRYQVAATLDGFIAGPKGEYDWIVDDPAIDFRALYREFDAVVMGRHTYEMMTAQGGNGSMPGMEVVVFSKTLPAAAFPGVRIVNDDPAREVTALKQKPGRDIWLFGGGSMFRSLLDAGVVDTVEIAVMPVLLGHGIPLLPPGSLSKLVLSHQKTLPKSGIVVLSYTVHGAAASAPPIRYVKPAKRQARRAKAVSSKAVSSKATSSKPTSRKAASRKTTGRKASSGKAINRKTASRKAVSSSTSSGSKRARRATPSAARKRRKPAK